ncbi:hypothetical protein OAK12_01935, partial [Alphaproteobacteria bacterium]|nr:hypothetical protein [Alphaproteobacteria bacterium]
YLEYQELRRFFQSYLNSFLFLLMMFFMILHAKLGCETIISDYIKTPYLFKIFKNVINFFTIFSLLLVIVAITKISIT